MKKYLGNNMKNNNKITLVEIKKRFTEIWKKKNDLKAFIKHNNNIIEEKKIEIELMESHRTEIILEYIRQNPDRMSQDRICFDVTITGPIR
jgi:predicted XRE-type DNA-binding protein